MLYLEGIIMRHALIIALVGASSALTAVPASASLIFNSQIQLSAQGFGNAPKILTLQGNGNTSGCVGTAAGGALTFGTGCTADATILGNGVTNRNGTADMPNPLVDDLKYGNPTVASLGWASAADIGVLFNATEPGADGIDVLDVTLAFYDAVSGNIIASIDGSQSFASTNPGNGSAGFVFEVDATQQALLNPIIFGGRDLTNVRIGIGATLANAAAGPDSFAVVNLNQAAAVPEPATWGMMTAGFGMMGASLRTRRRGTTVTFA